MSAEKKGTWILLKYVLYIFTQKLDIYLYSYPARVTSLALGFDPYVTLITPGVDTCVAHKYFRAIVWIIE